MAPVKTGAIVAVTGASGFIGSHCCAALLEAGYHVRAVVRNPDDKEKTAHLSSLGGADGKLTLHKGDLGEEGSYDDALKGADAVLHTAAVVELRVVSDPETQVVKPSVDGVKNVLASAEKSGSIQRFVHTSSILSAFKWDEPLDKKFSEADWNTVSTVANGDAYGYGKAKAEEIVLKHRSAKFDSVAILPGVSIGPCLTQAHTKSSAILVEHFIQGSQQPEYNVHLVDVRDVARAHVVALSVALLDGDSRRFVATSDINMLVSELEPHLRRLFPDLKMDANPMPNAPIRALIRMPLLWRLMMTAFIRNIVTQRYTFDNSKSKKQLELVYRPLDETLQDTVKSMVDSGFVKARMENA